MQNSVKSYKERREYYIVWIGIDGKLLSYRYQKIPEKPKEQRYEKVFFNSISNYDANSSCRSICRG